MEGLTRDQAKLALYRLAAAGWRVIDPKGVDLTATIVEMTPLRVIKFAHGIGKEVDDNGSTQQPERQPAVPEGTEGNTTPTTAA